MDSNRLAHHAGLLVAGFAIGGAALLSYDPHVRGALFNAITSAHEQPLALACIPDANTQEDEIFFLSCGGIF